MELLKTQINILVYDLYGLTDPEKEIIRKGGNKEISARLSFLGNIRQPMALNILGRILV